MIILISHERDVFLNLDATVRWRASASMELGSAEFTIPRRNSPAWDDEVIDVRGGSLTTIGTTFGTWPGVTDIPQWPPEGASIEADHVAVWLEDMRVGTGYFTGLAAGLIVRAAFRQAIQAAGAPVLTLGHVAMAGPVVPEFTLDRQPLLDVLNELHEQTGQEWTIDEHYRFHWLPHEGEFHDRWPIVDDGRLFPRLAPGTLDDRPGEVLEVDESGRVWRARGDDPRPLRPKTDLVRL